jgi:glucose-6-phosphate isomerase
MSSSHAPSVPVSFLSSTSEYAKGYYWQRKLGLSIDYNNFLMGSDLIDPIEEHFSSVFGELLELEAGGIANSDEGRMVGHYWLRDPDRAPDRAIKKQIESELAKVLDFAQTLHSGVVRPKSAERFKKMFVIGIGGSALGPQFLTHALSRPDQKMDCFFLDNTDVEGMSHTVKTAGDLNDALFIVISKSGGTTETMNGFAFLKSQCEELGISFESQAVAITCEGSKLDSIAKSSSWLEQFYIWDWIGGRTSVCSAVGLLPLALCGFEVKDFLRGAAECDEATRVPSAKDNPAALLAASWYRAGEELGKANLVVLPYRDRLELFSKYLQQLIMESVGKELDRDGKTVHTGLSVFGNKGSTDQHAFVQQLRDGRNDFFVHFIEVLSDKTAWQSEGEADLYSQKDQDDYSVSDYLSGFLQGTTEALRDNDRQSITITIDELGAYSLGQLVALFERAVSFYASLKNINAYHQPGVEAGKKAAKTTLERQKMIEAALEKIEGEISFSALVDNLQDIPCDVVLRVLRRSAAQGALRLEGNQLTELQIKVR